MSRKVVSIGITRHVLLYLPEYSLIHDEIIIKIN